MSVKVSVKVSAVWGELSNSTVPGRWEVLSPTKKETGYSDQTLTFSSPYKKKNSEVCPSNQVSTAAMTSASEEKWRPFNCFFSRVGLRIYQHPCNVGQLSQCWNLGQHSLYSDYAVDWTKQGSNTGWETRVFSPLKLPNRLWDSASLLFNGYRGTVDTGCCKVLNPLSLELYI